MYTECFPHANTYNVITRQVITNLRGYLRKYLRIALRVPMSMEDITDRTFGKVGTKFSIRTKSGPNQL